MNLDPKIILDLDPSPLKQIFSDLGGFLSITLRVFVKMSKN
jgi:hypothetical protein